MHKCINAIKKAKTHDEPAKKEKTINFPLTKQKRYTFSVGSTNRKRKTTRIVKTSHLTKTCNFFFSFTWNLREVMHQQTRQRQVINK